MCVRRFPGGSDLADGDERLHVGDGRHHRGVAGEGAAGAELHRGVSGGEPLLHRAAVAPHTQARRAHGARLLHHAPAAEGKD